MALMYIALASFAYVFLRAFQQLNVQAYAYHLVIPTSVCMALGDVYLVVSYAKSGGPSWPLVLTVGIASGSGSMAAMFLRKRMTR
jgi:hypothetical protein